MHLRILFRGTYLYNLRHVGLHPLKFQCLCFQRWGGRINKSSVDWTSLESPRGASHLRAILCAWLQRMHRLERMHAAKDLRHRILRGIAKNVKPIITSMSIYPAKNVTIVCAVEVFRIGMNTCGVLNYSIGLLCIVSLLLWQALGDHKVPTVVTGLWHSSGCSLYIILFIFQLLRMMTGTL